MSNRSIADVATQLGLGPDDIEPHGRLKAKLCRPQDAAVAGPPGKLILVTAMTPTRAGSGKTVTSIGLGQAFGLLGLRHCVCLREPSLGPTLGMKGGAAGGGRAQLVPMQDINLHFTGDLHAITSAHNLLAATVDNHAHFEGSLSIDRDAIRWPRVMDLCDRQLRHVELGLGGQADGFAHRSRFDITAASEVMAVAALARDRADLRARLARMLVAKDTAGRPLTVGQLDVVGAMEALLLDAVRPNLVQTAEGTPVLVHLGPFANIAHGCSSVVATRAALGLCDYVVTEAGFGADLGAEKFVHIKCRQAGLSPAAAVVVVTAHALRKHGGAGKGRLHTPDPVAVEAGLANLRVHLENLDKLGVPAVVALNRFPVDTDAEVNVIRRACDGWGTPFAVSEAFARGGEGCVELAERVRALADGSRPTLKPLYAETAPLRTKIETIARELYRVAGVDFAPEALRALDELTAQGHGELAICMAKTPLSLSDDPKHLGVPRDHHVRVRDVQLRAGAAFVVALTGEVVTMPGMPRHGAAERLEVDAEGQVRGLF